VPPTAAAAMRMYEAQHSRDMKGRRPTAGENMKLALTRVKVVGDRRSIALPSAASSAAPTMKGVGAGDRDDWKVSTAAPRKVSNIGFLVSVMMIGFDGVLNGGHRIEV